MIKGESKLTDIDIMEYGFPPEAMPTNSAFLPARVTAVHKERYAVVCRHGEIHAKLKTGVYFNGSNEAFPTTGDFILITYNPDGDSLIVKTLERKSKFARNDFSGHAVGYVKTIREQVVAANFDYVFIMQSLNHDLNPRRLERYLTLALQSGAVPIIVLTKADLTDHLEDQLKEIGTASAGADLCAVSARTGYGLNSLSKYILPRKTVVFLGSSGVGKSTLVNALAGEELMEINDIRESDSRGRHTTTHRQLIRLKSGVILIDTPGMRELGMWEVGGGLGEAFADVEQFLGKCRFSDCRHQGEPGCAVKEALDTGILNEERWNSYLRIKREAKFVDCKSAKPNGRRQGNGKQSAKSGRYGHKEGESEE